VARIKPKIDESRSVAVPRTAAGLWRLGLHGRWASSREHALPWTGRSKFLYLESPFGYARYLCLAFLTMVDCGSSAQASAPPRYAEDRAAGIGYPASIRVCTRNPATRSPAVRSPVRNRRNLPHCVRSSSNARYVIAASQPALDWLMMIFPPRRCSACFGHRSSPALAWAERRLQMACGECPPHSS